MPYPLTIRKDAARLTAVAALLRHGVKAEPDPAARTVSDSQYDPHLRTRGVIELTR